MYLAFLEILSIYDQTKGSLQTKQKESSVLFNLVVFPMLNTKKFIALGAVIRFDGTRAHIND